MYTIHFVIPALDSGKLGRVVDLSTVPCLKGVTQTPTIFYPKRGESRNVSIQAFAYTVSVDNQQKLSELEELIKKTLIEEGQVRLLAYRVDQNFPSDLTSEIMH